MNSFSKKSLLSLALAGSLLSVAPQTQAIPVDLDAIMETSKQIGAAAFWTSLFGSLAYYYYKEPFNTDTPYRYDMEKLKKAVKEQNWEEVRKQLWFIYDDSVIGVAYKSRKLKSDDGTILWLGSRVDPRGVFGNVETFIKKVFKPAAGAFGMVTVMNDEGFNVKELQTQYGNDHMKVFIAIVCAAANKNLAEIQWLNSYLPGLPFKSTAK